MKTTVTRKDNKPIFKPVILNVEIVLGSVDAVDLFKEDIAYIIDADRTSSSFAAMLLNIRKEL
jgi:hypothetical protein